MKSVKDIVIDGLKFFRQQLLSDTVSQSDSNHALSRAGGYSLQQQINQLNQSLITVSLGTISSLPVTKTVNGVNSNMVVLESTLGTPSAQTSDWTVTTSTNSIQISGSISGSTTLTLVLGTPVTKTVS